jgi:hypothetical protein
VPRIVRPRGSSIGALGSASAARPNVAFGNDVRSPANFGCLISTETSPIASGTLANFHLPAESVVTSAPVYSSPS